MPLFESWTAAPSALLAALAFGYLLGSIPFGLLLTKMAGMGDVRDIGSGNIGATNVLRTGNKKIAAATLIGDVLKGTVPVLIASTLGKEHALMAGLGAYLGHCFPVWLNFKGGKGVATFIGVAIATAWKVVVIFGVIWLTCAAVTRYSSLSGLLASLATPAAFYWLGHPQWAVLFALLTLILWIKHRQNISRLFRGEEGKIGNKG